MVSITGGAVSGADVTAEPITIDVWLSDHPMPGFLDPVVKMADEFNQTHPAYHIRLRKVLFRDLPREVVKAVDEGNPPDIAEFYITSSQLARDMLPHRIKRKPAASKQNESNGDLNHHLRKSSFIDGFFLAHPERVYRAVSSDF